MGDRRQMSQSVLIFAPDVSFEHREGFHCCNPTPTPRFIFWEISKNAQVVRSGQLLLYFAFCPHFPQIRQFLCKKKSRWEQFLKVKFTAKTATVRT